jgi:hypothetical protein
VAIGNTLYELGLARAHGLELVFIGGQVLAVAFGVVGRQQDGPAGEPRFDAVHGRDCFSLLSTHGGGELGIGATGGHAGFI